VVLKTTQTVRLINLNPGQKQARAISCAHASTGRPTDDSGCSTGTARGVLADVRSRGWWWQEHHFCIRGLGAAKASQIQFLTESHL